MRLNVFVAAVMVGGFVVSIASGRTWTDRTGKFSVEGELVEVKAASVVLKTLDGRTIDVPIAKLSDEDRAFVLARKAPAKPIRWKTTPAAVEGELAKQTRYEFTQAPLAEILDELSQRHGIPVVVDSRSLADAGIGPRITITAKCLKTPLEEGITTMLGSVKLAWYLDDGVVTITAEKEAERHLLTRIYRMARTVVPDEIIEHITQKVAPNSWDDMGGPGAIASTSLGLLVIRQTYHNHRRIEKQYGNVLRRTADAKPAPPRDPVGKALRSNTECDFAGTPLAQAVATLAARHGIKMRIDEQALADVGKAPDVPITRNLRGVTLASALKLILRELDLTYTVDQGALIITTPEKAETMLTTVHYPIGDLLGPGGYDELIDVITTTIRPMSWQDVGGPGTAKAVPGTRSLAVTQTYAIHQEVQALLSKLRAGLR